MKRTLKQVLILIAGFVCSLLLGIVCIVPTNGTVSASAATMVGSRLQGDTGLFIEEGAAVRVKSSGKETNGLRYTIGLNKQTYEGYMSNPGIEDIVFGILIAPATSVYDLNQASVFGIGGEQRYDWAKKDANGEWVYTGDGSKTRIINFESDRLFEVAGKPTDAYYYQGSIVNIQASNLTQEFRGVGYVLYTVGGTRCCEMLTNETHVRSIVYVAQKAIEDGNANSDWLKTNYIDKATTRTWNYTTENYLEQADGSFVKDTATVTTKTGELNTTVSADNAPSFTGLHYDPTYDLGVSSGIVLANNKLVLKRYYRLGYEMPAATTPSVKQTSALTVANNTDKTALLLNNVGENYAAITFSKTNANDFAPVVLNIIGSVENVWVGGYALTIRKDGVFLTSNNINDDSTRIASFNSVVLSNASDYYTVIYKLSYQGNEYYSNGIKFELWTANHASGADLSQVTFTKARVSEILSKDKAEKHYLTKDLILKYSAVDKAQYTSTDCTWMVQQDWNANNSWTMRKVQILSAQPKDQGAPDMSVNVTSKTFAPNNNGTAYTLINNYQTGYVNFTLKPQSVPTDNNSTFGICLNMLGETYNNYWNGGLILKLSNDGLLLWKDAVNSDAGGTPIAMFVSAAHNYNWAAGFSISYKLEFASENEVVLEIYLKMSGEEFKVLEPLQLAGDGISYKDGKYTIRTSIFENGAFLDCTLFAHAAYNTGCEYWTVSGVSLSDNPPVSEGYDNPVTEDVATVNIDPVEEIDHTVDTVKTLITNLNENYAAITVKASNLTSSTYYAIGLNVLGTTTTGWDGGVVLSLSKDGAYLKQGGMNGTNLAQLGTGGITRLDTSITIAYKLSFGSGELSDRVAIQFWTASAGSAFAPLECLMAYNGCTYNESTQQYVLPYTLFTAEEYKADCTVIFLSDFNNQAVPCDWEIQDVQILSASPDALTNYWENPAYAGIAVDGNGVMTLGGSKLYTAGVNCYALFNQCWNADVSKISIEKAKMSLDALADEGIKVVRFNCGGYLATSQDTGAKTIAMFEANKDALIALLKDIAAYAEDKEIGLIPSFFWLYSAVPSYCGETPNAWGEANSKTRAYMVEYTTLIVNELKGFHSIFGWEFGNEFNLHCDLPNATEEFKLEDVNSAVSAFTATVQGLDVVPSRFLGSGHSAPRPAQYNLSVNGTWTEDTDAQYSTVTNSLNPCNAISEHIYHDTNTSYTFSEYLTRAMNMASSLKKAYYVGEWGHGNTSDSNYTAETYYRGLADAIVGAKVQLSLLWNYDVLDATEKSFSTGDTRSDMLWQVLKDMNATLATY